MCVCVFKTIADKIHSNRFIQTSMRTVIPKHALLQDHMERKPAILIGDLNLTVLL